MFVYFTKKYLFRTCFQVKCGIFIERQTFQTKIRKIVITEYKIFNTYQKIGVYFVSSI